MQNAAETFGGLHASRGIPFLRFLAVIVVVLIPLSRLLSLSNTLFLSHIVSPSIDMSEREGKETKAADTKIWTK